MLASCGGGNADGVQKGSLSKFDSLSYALGANIGYSLGYQMKDIPFDAQLIRKGVEETALGKSSLSHDDALETLRTYFMTKRGERAQAIAKQRAEADSVRRAGGDTTKVEYPAADPAMFATEEERDSLSYALGNDIGFTIANAGLPLQVVWIGQAIQDVFDNTAKMPEKEVGQYLQHYFMVTMPMQNAKASEEWLSKIEKQSGVKKTESGLLYKVIKEGRRFGDGQGSARRGEGALHGPHAQRARCSTRRTSRSVPRSSRRCSRSSAPTAMTRTSRSSSRSTG